MKFPITIMAILLAIAPMAATAQTEPTTGKEIFEQMCAGCHGTYGNGQEGTKSGCLGRLGRPRTGHRQADPVPERIHLALDLVKIGRASCRERV